MRKSYRAAGICAAVPGAYALALRFSPSLFRAHKQGLKRLFAALGRVSSRVPMPLAELIALAALSGGAIWFIRVCICAFRRRSLLPLGRALAALLCVCLSLTGLGFALWPVYADEGELARAAYSSAYSPDELKSLIAELDRHMRKDEALLDFSGGSLRPAHSYDELAQRVCKAYTESGAVGDVVKPKPVRYPEWMQALNAAGMFMPVTGEALICLDDVPSALPFTLLHEVAHSQGVLREDEANRVALRVGWGAEDAVLRWCSSLTALRYALNTLRALDTAEFERVYADISTRAQQELTLQGAFVLPARRTSAYVYSGTASSAAVFADSAEPFFARSAELGDYDGVIYMLLYENRVGASSVLP